jgi:plasmid segregation protein ParM
MTTIIGLDVGYSHTKVVYDGGSTIFPSLTGTADLSRFSASSNHASRVISYSGIDHFFGEDAVDLSRLSVRREDRSWITSDEYSVLVRAALSYAIRPTALAEEPISLITGLPLAFYAADRNLLHSRLSTISSLTWRQGDNIHPLYINLDAKSLRVVPQPFGSLFSQAFGTNGQIIDPALLQSQVGIVDIGGKTTNLLVASRARDVARASNSIPTGGWEVVRAVRAHLAQTCSDANLRDHQIATAIANNSFSYYGEQVNLAPVVSEVAAEFCQSIAAEASQLWGAGAELNTILISGGGANLIGNQLAAHFHRHADVRIVEDAQTANAVGYYRYGLFLNAIS